MVGCTHKQVGRARAVALRVLLVVIMLLVVATRVHAQTSSAGGVWTWGWNGTGQLGNSSVPIDFANGRSTTPVSVDHLSGVIAIAAGLYQTVALKSDGTVWTWGDGRYGLLGNGMETGPTATPSQVPGLDHVIAIAAGTTHTLALRSDGTVWAWGDDDYGEIGVPATTTCNLVLVKPCVLSPVQVPGLGHVVAIAAGYLLSVALEADGTVWSWGDNRDGALGNGTRNDYQNSTPVQAVGLSNVVAVSAYMSTYAVESDGSVWVWGDAGPINQPGSCGGAPDCVWIPTRLRQFSHVTSVAVSSGGAYALTSAGTVLDTGGTPIDGLSGVQSVAAGQAFGLAVTEDGTVWAWGANQYGQLGDASTTDRPAPAPVPGLGPVSAIAAGVFHAVALAAPPRDATPPIITPTIVGTQGSNGWYTTSVTVRWVVNDPESGIDSSTGCSSITLTDDTAGATLTCSATNGAGLSSSQSVTLKIDQTPPTCSVSMAPGSIWPANHKLVPVKVTVQVQDALSGPASFVLTNIATNEGTVANEISGFVIGTPSTSGQILADRFGTGTGRVYSLTYAAKDQAGNTSTCFGNVTVPHDERD